MKSQSSQLFHRAAKAIHGLGFVGETTLYTGGDGGIHRWDLDGGTHDLVFAARSGYVIDRMRLDAQGRTALVYHWPTTGQNECLSAELVDLAAAHRLVELDPAVDVSLFEAGPRLGGVLSTIHEHGFQVEQSADNFITTIPYAVDLCRRLGLADELVQTNPKFRRTFVVHKGRLAKLPDGFLMMAPTRFWPLVVTPLLSPLGKARAALELETMFVVQPASGLAGELWFGLDWQERGRPLPDGYRYASDTNSDWLDIDQIRSILAPIEAEYQ